MKTIVITRPKGDEKIITDLLHAHGYRVIHEPLTDIFLRHTERLVVQNALLAEPDAVLITSRHAAQALSLLTDLRDAYLLCVGEATAQTAISLGFTRVASAGGTVAKMIDYIIDGYDPSSRFFYVSGEFVRGDLDASLIQQGMDVQRVVVYDAIAASQLSDTLVEQMRRKQVDAVTFLSPRAEAKVERGDVGAALKEMAALSPPATTIMAPWTNNAQAFLHVRETLDALQLAILAQEKPPESKPAEKSE